MEADWAVEIGEDLPRIVVPWAEEAEDPQASEGGSREEGRFGELGSGPLRFVDLRADPEAVAALPEVRGFPALGRALVRLNSAVSPAFTSKCDVFPIEAAEIDPWEFDAEGDATAALGCYIDLVLRDDEVFSSFAAQEAWLRRTVKELRGWAPLRGARVDLVLRAATAFGREGFGVTLYLAGCGANEDVARQRLEAALERVVGLLAPTGSQAE